MSLVDELTKLAELHRTGAISDAEYATAKARVLSDSPAPPAQPVSPSEPPPVQPQQDSNAAPKWMKPWGWFLLYLGILGFVTSIIVGWYTWHDGAAAFLAGLLNPLFLISTPIGLYWLARSGVTVGGVLTAINQSTMSKEEKRRRGL